MDRASSLLEKVLQKRGLKQEADSSLITHIAQQWITENLPDICEHIQAKKFEQESLFLACSNPIAQQECWEASDPLLTYLREKKPNIDIKNIRMIRA